jgi:hypothetical protein
MPGEDKMADKNRFSDGDWRSVASIVSAAFAMDDARAARLLANSTAKFIAALPFLAGCRKPERTALAHLATYVIAGSPAGEAAFDHDAGDDYDVLARLATIGGFEGGDPAVINRGMKILARIMIQGYRADIEADKAGGKYNPLGAGAWDSGEKLASLDSSIASTTDAEMDALFPSGAGPLGTWWQLA